MITTRCKFQVYEVATQNWTVIPDGPKAQRIKANAVYDDGLSKENKSFSSATPTGSLEFTITNPNVIGNYQPGDYFYLDLIPCEQ